MFSEFPLCLLCQMMLGVFTSLSKGSLNTGFSRALFPSSIGIFADLLGTFPAVQVDLGLWFLLVFIYLHSFHIFLIIYFCDEVNMQVSGLPYMSDKQSLLPCLSGVFLCSLSLITCSFLPELGVEWTDQEGR